MFHFVERVQIEKIACRVECSTFLRLCVYCVYIIAVKFSFRGITYLTIIIICGVQILLIINLAQMGRLVGFAVEML